MTMTLSALLARSAAALLAAVLMLAAPAAGALTDDDNACLGCHAQEGLAKTFGKGESLPPRVDGAAVDGSAHPPP